jgi:lipopolysaccharide/colanic/teichoic acid biosynthesis glycosyltransferase
MYKNGIKRFFDLFIAILVIIILSPLLIFCIIFIPITSKGPIFFKQERLGLNGKYFLLYKFRTMYNKERKVDREILKGDNEVTKIGGYLRRLKIDELPQLLNVIIGDMSLIGPRPCMTNLQENFNEDGKFRILVRPGLTGMAQTNGNIYLKWEERWKYDRYYVEHLNFLLDLRILIKTVLIVVLGENKFIKKFNV